VHHDLRALTEKRPSPKEGLSLHYEKADMTQKGIWRRALVVLALAAGARPPAAGQTPGPPLRRWAAQNVALEAARSDAACLILPVDLTYDAGTIYVVDAQDCAVKLFSKQGKFMKTVGRKGCGPGEFLFPSGVSAVGGCIHVADKLNRRIQVLDASGRQLRSFGVPFAPDKVFALGKNRVLVTHNPSGRSGSEKMLHAFDERGYLLWERLDSRASGDPLADAFANMILVNPGARGDFFVVFKSRERSISHFGNGGELLGRIETDARHLVKDLLLTGAGRSRVIPGFCWASAFDGDRLFLLAPHSTDGQDLGPGIEISVIDRAGRLESLIRLPFPVTRMAVEGDRIYAIDADGEFRILRIVR
jgi:hypothetical protein